MAFRIYIDIRDKEKDATIFKDQLLGNYCHFNETAYKNMGIEPDEDGCFEATEVPYEAFLKELVFYYKEAIEEMFKDMDYDDFKESVLNPAKSYFSKPDWSLIGSFPYRKGVLDTVINKTDYMNRSNTFTIILKGS